MQMAHALRLLIHVISEYASVSVSVSERVFVK